MDFNFNPEDEISLTAIDGRKIPLIKAVRQYAIDTFGINPRLRPAKDAVEAAVRDLEANMVVTYGELVNDAINRYRFDPDPIPLSSHIPSSENLTKSIDRDILTHTLWLSDEGAITDREALAILRRNLR